LIVDHSKRLPRTVKDAIEKHVKESKTKTFDTHPSDVDRVKSVRALELAPIFKTNLPATALFANFGKLSRDSTLAFYAIAVGKNMSEVKLVPTTQLLAKGERVRESMDAGVRFFQGTILPTHPGVFVQEPLEPTSVEDPATTLGQCRTQLLAQAPAIREMIKKYNEDEMLVFESIRAKSLQLGGATYVPSDPKFKDMKAKDLVERQARYKIDANASLRKLETFSRLHRQRLGVVLSMEAPGGRERLQTLLICLGNLQPSEVQINQIRESLHVCSGLFEQLKNHSKSQALINRIVNQSDLVRDSIIGVRRQTGEMDYPFEHSKEKLTLKQFLVSMAPPPGSREVTAILNLGSSVVERYLDLTQRILGEIGHMAQKMEEQAGLEHLPKPPEEIKGEKP
jgi:hypothetical protein